MTTPTYATLTHNGLWKNNPALVQLLGLCPLLAVSASVVNSLGLAAATLFVLISSNLCVSVVRNVVSDTIRLPVFVMIIAASVTAIELLMQAYTYELYQILGIFLPLITTNCIILGRADAFAAHVARALKDRLEIAVVHELHAAGLAATTRMDLSLDHPSLSTNVIGRFHRRLTVVVIHRKQP